MNSLILRPYQTDCLNSIITSISSQLALDREQPRALVQAPTGSGKTVIMAFLVDHLRSVRPNERILIISHKKEIVYQTLQAVCTVSHEEVGVACASINAKMAWNCPIVVGSIQTVISNLDKLAGVGTIIIDEVHRLPPMNHKSQYKNLIAALPNATVIGFTATPYRLGHGYIYGERCHPKNINLFDDLSYQITIKNLQSEGYLCPYKAKGIIDLSKDLQSVRSHGEYNVGDLDNLMTGVEHLGSAVYAIQDYAVDRNSIVGFGVTINHCLKLERVFRDAGIDAHTIHSKMSLDNQRSILSAFSDGDIRLLLTVGIVIEGVDIPRIDCILSCAPTKSAAKHVQGFGRGLRPWNGKEDFLFLDLANNCIAHGDVNDPVVVIPSGKRQKGDPVVKCCPGCFEIIAISYKKCPECGYVFVEMEEKEHVDTQYKLYDINWNVPTVTAFVKRIEIVKHISKANNRMLKVILVVGIRDKNGWIDYSKIYHYLDIEGSASSYGQYKAQRIWEDVCQTTAPFTVEEALQRKEQFYRGVPRQITLKKDGQYWKVHTWLKC